MTASGTIDQGGLEAVAGVDRVASLTGVRAVAALLVVATHAAYTTGKYTHGYVGLVFSRMEIGVPIFFVLSGFLLFGPWVRAAASGSAAPSVWRYARNRVRRIMPAYVVTVLVAYLIYHFREAGPNPGHSWNGLLRNLTLTQIYTDAYMFSHLHQGLTQMWSLAVEVAFYPRYPSSPTCCWWCCAAAVGDQVCCWGPGRTGTDQSGVDGAGAHGRFPARRRPAVAARVSGVVHRRNGADGAGRDGCSVLLVPRVPLAVLCYFIASTPIAGEATTSPTGLAQALVKIGFYTAIATLVVAPLALGDTGAYSRLLSSRPMVWLGEISYEIFLVHLIVMEFAMVEVLHWRVYTGSMPALFAVTLALTIPVAWVLHRFTRVR